MRRAPVAGAVLLALVACAGGPPRTRVAPPLPDARFEFRQVVMAVEARLVLHAPDEPTARAAAAVAFAELEGFDAVASDYRADSELMQLCAQAAEADVTLAPGPHTLGTLLSLADDARRASDGAFDVSVGPLTRLWRDARRSGRLPSVLEVESARAGVGHWSFEVLPQFIDGRRVTLGRGTQLDLGGLAKGYALGWALACCEKSGASAALLEMGGDLAVGDPPPGQPGWEIVVPAADGGAPQRMILARTALSVSGDASQHLDAGGVRYGHIVNPRTGWALTNGRQALALVPYTDRGVPAMAEAGAAADVLATSACVLEAPAARRLAGQLGASFVVADPAFTPLFDGATLDGWTPRGGRYDGDARWTVEDGCLAGRTGPGDAGGLLYTAAPHTSFEFQCEVKLDHPFDSGIFVRMSPEGRGLQLTLDDRPDGEIGGLYSDGWIEHARPEAAAAWRRDDWNHVFVRCTGFDLRLEAWINGVQVADRVVPQEFGADGAPVFAPRGLIGVQVHGGGSEGTGHAARFRDLQVRDLPVLGEVWAADRALSPPERASRAAARAAEGWRDLLAPGADGTPLAAWEAVDGEGDPRAPDDYRVVAGALEIPSSPPSGTLRTRDDFEDFVLRCDVQLARMANGGLFLRARRESVGPDGARVPGGNPAYSGCEVQLLDDWNWEAVTGTELQPWQFTGSLYGAVPPGLSGLLRPIGEWNTLEVLARGPRLACALNGQTLWDVDASSLAADPPFAQRARAGFLGLQRYAAPDVEGDVAVRVRDLFLRRL